MSTATPGLTAEPDPLPARRAVIRAPGTVELVSEAVPAPGPGEVRIRVEGCGVCGSNLPLWEGREWFEYPRPAGDPGHEAWGRIEALGAGVEGLSVGERVAALSQRAYAELDIAAADAVVPLPSALDDRPFPGEPLACAMNVFRRSAIEPGQTVAIVGIGFLGALLTQLASAAGAHVIAISRRPFALDIARRCGAHETIAFEDPPRIVEQVRELNGGHLCDRVLEVVGAQPALDLAGELVRERGRLVIAGFHQDGPRTVNMFLWNWRGLDVVNAHERDPAIYMEGMRAAVAAVVEGVLDPTPLYTHEYPLDRLADALNALRDRPDGFLKALVRP